MSAAAASRRTRRLAFLRSLALILGWLATAGSVLVMVGGWWFRVEVIASLMPGEATMKFNLAFAVGLAGVATVLLSTNRSRRVADALGMLVVLIGVATLFEHFTGSSARWFDELLANEFASAPASEPPGRMSVNSATALALVGSGIILHTREIVASRVLLVTAGIVAYLAFVGYLLDVPQLSGLLGASPMALTTSLLLMVLVVALTFLQPPELIVTDALGGDIARRFLPATLIGMTLVVAVIRWLLATMLEDPLFAVQITVVLVISITMLGTATIAQRVNRLSEDLRTAQAQLQAANAELSRFTSVAAHDLRAPLRKVGAFHERVRFSLDRGEQERALDYLTRAEDTVDRLYDLLEDILALGNVDRAKRNVESVALSDVLTQVVSDLADKGADTAVRTRSLPTIEADPAQMYLLFVNLVSNGLKFAHPDRDPQIVISGRSAGDGTYEISVTDNGVGFDPASAEGLFEPFARGATGSREGSGIGLAVCRRIAETHGGSIRADSGEGMGSTFTVRLPSRQPTQRSQRS